ncbi:MAG: hypothetical protein JWO88_3612 [Frankiales bacterium]|nr:hypothetical protein [Frankiales bacterium]
MRSRGGRAGVGQAPEEETAAITEAVDRSQSYGDLNTALGGMRR